jgi:hypothetical protein
MITQINTKNARQNMKKLQHDLGDNSRIYSMNSNISYIWISVTWLISVKMCS